MCPQSAGHQSIGVCVCVCWGDGLTGEITHISITRVMEKPALSSTFLLDQVVEEVFSANIKAGSALVVE